MTRIYYTIDKNIEPKRYVYALKCDNKFYVITQRAYKQARKKIGNMKPIFLADLPVYIDGINI